MLIDSAFFGREPCCKRCAACSWHNGSLFLDGEIMHRTSLVQNGRFFDSQGPLPQDPDDRQDTALETHFFG